VSPALEQVARDLAGKIKLVKVNVDAAPKLSERFSIQAVPTLMLLRNGHVVARQAGAAPAQVLREWGGGGVRSGAGKASGAAGAPSTPTNQPVSQEAQP